MKKLFLIPLMACFTCVMAWGETITVGEGGDHATLSDAVAAASAGDVVQLVSDLTGEECNFNKAITVDFNGHTVTPRGNWMMTVNDATVTFTDNSLAKNGGITVGKGCLDVYSKAIINGGIYTTSVNSSGTGIYCNPNAEVTINNCTVNASFYAVVNQGKMIIKGGDFNSTSTSTAGSWAYCIMSDGQLTIDGGTITGVQGGLSVQDGGTAEINGGTFYTHRTEGAAEADNHYALYIATGAVVNIRGGQFSVETPSKGLNRVVLCDDNDLSEHSYGIANIYGGKYAMKVKVGRNNDDKNSTYPTSVPLTSQWYSSFGSEAPLPAGYEYYETGDATYPYGVRAIAGKAADGIDADAQAAQEADPTYTIPWQQATTWASDVVPVENTIVTIPVDATVTVSKDETTKEAVADQVFVAQGATLKVEEGTTLTVGDGGMNIGNGGQIVVEAGATVKIGSAGVITNEEEALVIESNDDIQGVLLYEPSVAENTRPKATVKLSTKAKQIGANSYVFERFAIPTVDGSATTYSIEGGIPTSGLYNDAPSFLQAVWEWNNATDEWEQLGQFKDMQPFHGYQLTNNSAAGGLVYVFEGNLVGNQSMDYEFVENGFHFFGNSYSADINIASFLGSLDSEVQKTVWVYDPYDKTFKTITSRTANGRVKYGNGEAIKDVRSMQAFLMYLADGESGTAKVNYASAIWGNPKYNGGAGAPARQEEVAEDWVTIRVSAANGLKDEVILNQSEDFTAAFENGADANKFMNKENINLYAATNAGNLAVVATNDLNNTVLTFAAGNASEYTLQFADIEGYEFTLRDNVTGVNVLMTEGATYTFNQEANTTVPARFEVLGTAKVPTAIENVEAAAKANGIYTVTGQFLGHDFTSLPAGVYVVNGVKIVK